MKKIFNIAVLLSIIFLILSLTIFLIQQNKLTIALFATFLTISYHLIMRWIVGNIIEPLLKINPNNKWFHQTRFEKHFYKLLKVKQWKKHLPTYDLKLFDLKTQSIDSIIQHMCRAEVIHELMCILSLMPILFSLYFGDVLVFLITSIAAMTLELCFIIVQRYNRERLVKLKIRIKQ